jgi:hypothetical protein
MPTSYPIRRSPGPVSVTIPERKLLYGRDDDLLAALDEQAQITRMLGTSDNCANLGKLLYGIADLLVQYAPVSHNDNGIENW